MFGQPLQENELYKIHVIKELTEAKIGAVNLNISKEEIFDIFANILHSISAVTNMVLCCFSLCALITIFYLLYVYFYLRGR